MGVGSLSSAQASLYQVSTFAFNHPSTGSASTTFALGTGLGSPKAGQVVSALVQLNTPGASVTTTTVAAAKSTGKPVDHVNVVIASPSDPTTITGGSSSSPSTTSGTEITALNPTTTSSSRAPTLAPVILVPAPLKPIVFNLGSSGSPVLAQIVNSPLAAQEEQPPSTNIFGQDRATELQKPFELPSGHRSDLPWMIDVVEPFQPLDPADAPKAKPDLGPAPVGGWNSPFLSPFAVDSAIEASNGGLFPLASLDLLTRAKRRLGETKTWEFSTVFGAAAVALGGFHLAMRESERFKTRWLPNRAGSRLPTGRWPGFRGR
jgi:hypothetical protein